MLFEYEVGQEMGKKESVADRENLGMTHPK